MKAGTVVVIAAVAYGLLCFAQHLGGEGAAERRTLLRGLVAPDFRPPSESQGSVLRIDVNEPVGVFAPALTTDRAVSAATTDPFRLMEARR